MTFAFFRDDDDDDDDDDDARSTHTKGTVSLKPLDQRNVTSKGVQSPIHGNVRLDVLHGSCTIRILHKLDTQVWAAIFARAPAAALVHARLGQGKWLSSGTV